MQKKIAHVDFSPLPNCRRERFDLAQAGKSENDSWTNKERDVGCQCNTSSSQGLEG